MGHDVEALAMAMFIFGLVVGVFILNDSREEDIIGTGTLVLYFGLVLKLGWPIATALLAIGFVAFLMHWNCEVRRRSVLQMTGKGGAR